jgi:hypothetical protein
MLLGLSLRSKERKWWRRARTEAMLAKFPGNQGRPSTSSNSQGHSLRSGTAPITTSTSAAKW